MSQVVKLAGELQTEAAIAGKKLEPAVARATERLYSRATADAPVATGELRSNIFRDTSGLNRRVGASVRQGFFQEYGTSIMPPQPWLVVHADRAQADLAAEVARIRWGFG